MGQFRAVASILVDMESTAIWYDEPLVLSIWDVLLNSTIRKTSSTFSSFLSHLVQCRSNLRPASGDKHGQHPGSSLLSSDRWLACQLGIALLRLHEQKQDWQAGFSILQLLHSFNLRYVELSQPLSNLPPLLSSRPSPCSVALTAVNLCLQNVEEGTSSAMEVLRGSDWVGASCTEELCRRTEAIITVAQMSLSTGTLDDVKVCLDAILSEGLMEKFVHVVTNLHNKLLQASLEAHDIQFALRVIGAMKHAKLQCLPCVFSQLLRILCEADEVWQHWMYMHVRTIETTVDLCISL